MFSKSFKIKKARNLWKGFCFVLDCEGKLTMTQIECFEWPLKLRNSLIYYSLEISWWSKFFFVIFIQKFPDSGFEDGNGSSTPSQLPLGRSSCSPKAVTDSLIVDTEAGSAASGSSLSGTESSVSKSAPLNLTKPRNYPGGVGGKDEANNNNINALKAVAAGAGKMLWLCFFRICLRIKQIWS